MAVEENPTPAPRGVTGPERLLQSCRAFAGAGLALSLLATGFGLVLRSEAENAVLFGFSGPRLLVLLAFLAGDALFLGLLRGLRRARFRSHWVDVLQRTQFRLAFGGSAFCLLAIGFVLVASLTGGAAGRYSVYLEQLLPFIVWFSGIAFLGLYFAAAISDRPGAWLRAGVVLLVIMTAGAAWIYGQTWSGRAPRTDDIYFVYLEGTRLVDGENPYARVLAGDMRVNDKYAT